MFSSIYAQNMHMIFTSMEAKIGTTVSIKNYFSSHIQNSFALKLTFTCTTVIVMVHFKVIIFPCNYSLGLMS